VIGGAKQDGIVNFNRVGGDYFRTMETPLLSGRTFGTGDRLGATETAIVNESFVKRYFPGTNPIGQAFQIEVNVGEPQPFYEIVGLVKDTKYTDLREEFTPIAYLAASQGTDFYGPFLDLVLRSDMPPSSMTPALTQAIREIAPNSTVAYNTIRTFVRDSLVTERLMATLSGFFGGLAMLIATIGLYGVMSYVVSRRKVEIGIRMALGADPRKVVRMVIGESGLLLLCGVVCGTGLAVLSSRWAANLLFGLMPWDPASLVTAVALLSTVSLLAAWLPARRAARLTPTIALREE
jgi:predicted permease